MIERALAEAAARQGQRSEEALKLLAFIAGGAYRPSWRKTRIDGKLALEMDNIPGHRFRLTLCSDRLLIATSGGEFLGEARDPRLLGALARAAARQVVGPEDALLELLQVLATLAEATVERGDAR